MDRQRFLNNFVVKDFIDWLDRKIDPPGVFNHHYYLVKADREWSCSCLYEAYEKYWWPYNIASQNTGSAIRGSSFQESFSYLSALARDFRRAVEKDDVSNTIRCAELMLAWGGVLNSNREYVQKMSRKAPAYFKWVTESLDLEQVVLGKLNQIYINSGFTKLYFLLVDNFIMYDGRVGAALGLIGRLYAEEKGLNNIPPDIEFSFGSGKKSTSGNLESNRRDPSNEKYKLPEFGNSRIRRLKDNIKASWVLKAIADQTTSRFAQLPQGSPLNERLTAIQSALFMIGYDVLDLGVKEQPIQQRDLEFSELPQAYPYRTVAKRYSFRVDYDNALETLRFSYPTKDNGKRRAPDYFTLKEVENVCLYLDEHFGDAPFPLANNVVKLTSFNEEPGLGMAIRSTPGANVLKAQASSYLGPYLAEVGILKSVIGRRTMWRLVVEIEKAISMIKKFHRGKCQL